MQTAVEISPLTTLQSCEELGQGYNKYHLHEIFLSVHLYYRQRMCDRGTIRNLTIVSVLDFILALTRLEYCRYSECRFIMKQ